MDAIDKFFSMGGYGGYIWPAYGISAFIMIVLLVATVRGLRTRQATLDLLKGDESEADK